MNRSTILLAALSSGGLLSSRPPITTTHAFHVAPLPDWIPRRAVMSATAGTTGSEPSAKIREMASFLASQLLEKALMEAAKGEESKITEEQALALMATLQQTRSEVPTAQATPTSNGKVSEETVPDKIVEPEAAEVQEKYAVPPEEMSEPPVVTDGIPDRISVSVAEEEGRKEVLPVDMAERSVVGSRNEIFQRSLLAARIVNDQKKPAVKNEAASEAPNTPELTRPVILEALESSASTVLAVPNEAAPALATSSESVGRARIPAMISRDFGKPLEIEMDNVPALRISSIPKRSSECKSEDFATFTPTSDLTYQLSTEGLVAETDQANDAGSPVVSKNADSDQNSTVPVNQPKDEIPVTAAKKTMIKAKNELFQRSLFATRMAYDQAAHRTKVGRLQDDHDQEGGDDDFHNRPTTNPIIIDEVPVGDCVVEEMDNDSAASNVKEPYPLALSLDDQAVPILSELKVIPVQEESVNAAGSLSLLTPQARANAMLSSEHSESAKESGVPVAALSDDESIADDVSSVVVAAPLNEIMLSDPVKESPIDTNVSRVQPRSLAEEAQLSAKYAAIENLGDRAFAILRDLQMI